MGANFIALNIEAPDEATARYVFDEAQRRCRHNNGHSYSGGIGMADGIKFTPHSFFYEPAADEWLMDNAQKWEAALAVKVVPPDDPKGAYWRVGAWCSS